MKRRTEITKREGKMMNSRNSKRLIAITISLAFILSVILPAARTNARAARERQRTTSTNSSVANGGGHLPVSESQAQAAQSYGKLSMYFEANRGQTDRQVDFIARGAGYTLFLTPSEAVFVLTKADQEAKIPGRERSSTNLSLSDSGGDTKTPVTKCALRMKLEG